MSIMGKRKHANYSPEFRKSSAKLAFESEHSISKVAIELGLNERTLRGWVKSNYPDEKANAAANSQTNDELQSQLTMLEKENNLLKQERDILKKATAYFANEAQ